MGGGVSLMSLRPVSKRRRDHFAVVKGPGGLLKLDDQVNCFEKNGAIPPTA